MARSRLIDDIVALAQTPAPTFAEGPRLAWLEQRLAGAPGTRARDRAGSLVWRWGEGPPRVLVCAHVDTVFPADTPLDIRFEAGMLTGPGVGDNAAAVAVAVHVVERLLAERSLAPGAVAFTVGEEGLGNLRGATQACEDLLPTALIALEGHGLDRVIVDAVGSLRARVIASGPGGHSWDDRGAPSAIHGLVGLAGELLAATTAATPVNIGLISGGRSVNTIADAAELTVEMRATATAPLDGFAALLDRLRAPAPLRIAVEIVGWRPAGQLDRAAPLLSVVREVRRELGLADVLGAGSTDANAALGRGIPALCLGVTLGTGMHTLDERIAAAPLRDGCAQLERVLARLLGT